MKEKIYHICNRGVDRRDIFLLDSNFNKFIKKINNTNNDLKVLDYCLLLNHFHLLISSSEVDVIGKYMHKLQMGYTKYFNILNERTGSLFEGRFKIKEVNINDLEYVRAYVVGNLIVHGINNINYKWSSINDNHDKEYITNTCSEIYAKRFLDDIEM